MTDQPRATPEDRTPLTQVSTLDFARVEWRFLVFGMAMAFCSSLGQTYFISLFSAEIRADLNLGHAAFGSYYAIATTGSAITLIWLGKLADSMRVERLALFVISCLCISAFLFSQVFSAVTLVIGLYLLRLFGQGMTTHTYTTAIARRYVVARGRALSISQLGINLAESIGPVAIVALLVFFNWRSLWMILPLIPVLFLLPFLRTLTKRTRYQDGGGLEGLMAAATTDGQPPSTDDIVTINGTDHWRRRAVMRDRRFWIGLVGLTTVPGFSVTGIMFHQIHIADLVGVSLTAWAANYVLYALAAVIGALVAGQLVDRFTGRRVAAFLLTPLALACLCLWVGTGGSSGNWGVTAFFLFFGLTAGMPHTAITAAMAELYGTRYLGEIKAIFLPLGVFSSALSPMVMGVMIDFGYELPALMGLNILLALMAMAGAFYMLMAPPSPPTHSQRNGA